MSDAVIHDDRKKSVKAMLPYICYMRLYAVLHLTAVTGHGAGEWRQTIAEIWRDFKGLVSYNADKYQKHNVAWWDCVQNMCPCPLVVGCRSILGEGKDDQGNCME